VLECGICFEAVHETTVLPCSCKIDYCTLCWNKALARSFTSCGQARCPSCRGLVRVDFDAEANRLVFSKESEDMTYDHEVSVRRGLRGMAVDFENLGSPEQIEAHRAKAHRALQDSRHISNLRSETIERLAQQAMPAQVRILERFGEANSSLAELMNCPQSELCKWSAAALKESIISFGGDPSNCLEKSELVDRLLETASLKNILARWVSTCCAAPSCVCGSSLVRENGADRFRRQLGPGLSEADFADRMAAMNESSVICDLCDSHVDLLGSAFVWTCENGDATILHATAYDICNDCFMKNTCHQDAEPSSATR